MYIFTCNKKITQLPFSLRRNVNYIEQTEYTCNSEVIIASLNAIHLNA